MLRSCWSGVLKACKRFGYILRHGKIYGVGVGIPLEVDATEDFSVFVDGCVVMFLQGVDEMSGMCVADYFHSKVINNEVEDGGSSGMTKESWCVAGWMVAVFS